MSRARAGVAALGLAIATFVAGCASMPRPEVLAEADALGAGRAAAESKAFAPAAFAHAEKLRAEARDAFDHGDPSGAQILAEHALAAYAHAQALARIARAERGAVDSDAKLKRAEGELGGLEAEQAHAAADADALELQIRVTRDAQAVVPSGKVDPERERARLAAARSLALQARLLCAAARLLTTTPGGEASAARAAADPKIAAQLADATSAVDKLDDKLKPSATLAPIDEATRARAGCLAALTLVRRAATPVSRAPGVGDALLAELAAGALAPSRDDRGVVVTLRDAFHGESLTPDAEKKLKDLARVAAAHPAFPVEVVVHGGTPKGDEARAAAVAKALSAAAPGGKLRIEPVAAASASPVVDPAGPSRARNARVEIVFVTPETF